MNILPGWHHAELETQWVETAGSAMRFCPQDLKNHDFARNEFEDERCISSVKFLQGSVDELPHQFLLFWLTAIKPGKFRFSKGQLIKQEHFQDKI